jgi:hypothetical protein
MAAFKQSADTELFNQRPSDCQYERERNLCDHQPIALAESGDAVDDAKDGGVGADPERQGQDSDCGETRMLSERATDVDKIGHSSTAKPAWRTIRHLPKVSGR